MMFYILSKSQMFLVRLKDMEKDGLVHINSKSISITKKGQPFVRNVCMAFDILLKEKQPQKKLFSMTV